MEKVRDAALLIKEASVTKLEKHLYQTQVDKIAHGEAISRSLASLNACYLRMGIGNEWIGRVTRVEQSQFRSLLRAYDAGISRLGRP